MINLDQVRTLEWKVKQAVQLIVQLRRENDMLSGRLADTEVRLQELESMVETFRAAQSEMESGIRRSLDELDHLGPVDSLQTKSEASDADIVETEVVSEAPAPEMDLESEQSLEPDSTIEPEVAVQPDTPIAVELEPALEADEAFDEEYAALVAEEAASLVDPETPAEAEPEKKTAENERAPEQPGLGIF